LSATLLIEITEQDQIRAELGRMRGLDKHVWLDVAGDRVAGVFETGRESESKLSAGQYVRVPRGATRRARGVDGAALAIVRDHPAYRCSAPVPEVVRESLATELRDGETSLTALRRVRDG